MLHPHVASQKLTSKAQLDFQSGRKQPSKEDDEAKCRHIEAHIHLKGFVSQRGQQRYNRGVPLLLKLLLLCLLPTLGMQSVSPAYAL